MTYLDYYKILGLEKSASPKDIKNAYRKLARKFHPDLNPNNQDAKTNFQQVNEANKVLSDPAKRKKYDQYGKDWEHAGESAHQSQNYSQTSGSRGRTASSSQFGGGDFSDFFESMFGGTGARNSRTASHKGQDFTTELHLELQDAYKMHKQTLDINGHKIRITIPAGIENNQTIKISGHGAAGEMGGVAGDLYLTFKIPTHPTFKREHENLFAIVPLDIYTAILGGEMTIDTLDGKVKFNVKPETQNGAKINLRGKGFPVYKMEGLFGDLQITFSIVMPIHLTTKQKELFQELKAIQ